MVDTAVVPPGCVLAIERGTVASLLALTIGSRLVELARTAAVAASNLRLAAFRNRLRLRLACFLAADSTATTAWRSANISASSLSSSDDDDDSPATVANLAGVASVLRGGTLKATPRRCGGGGGGTGDTAGDRYADLSSAPTTL